MCSCAAGRLDPGDVGCEEVDAVAVEVAAGAVAVLGGAWVGISGEDLSVAQRISPSRRRRQRMTRIGNVEWQSDASPEERTSATPSGGGWTHSV
jgi:hypothetical protein